MLGVAYKKNIDDLRESPSSAIMALIRARGGEVAYSDPHVPAFVSDEEHGGSGFELNSLPLSAQMLKSFDAILLATDHDDFDYEMIKQHSNLIIDSRGRFRETLPNVIRA